MSAPIGTEVVLLAAVLGLGVYSVVIVGVTGGPNRGEHPLTCTLVHLAGFIWFGRGWPPATWRFYAGWLAVALIASLVGFGSRGFDRSRGKSTARYALAQAQLAAAYLAFGATLLWRHANP